MADGTDSRPGLSLENAAARAGHLPVAGVDEAGRGPLAGPVVAAAVILDPDRIPDGIDDSKALTEDRRTALYKAICTAADVAVASVPAARIDAINIRMATLTAMGRAIAALRQPPRLVLVDGRDTPVGVDAAVSVQAVVGGDRTSLSIAAASIVAKVTRDRLMGYCDATFPDYGFFRHKGYGTTAHRAALYARGPTPIHRMSFAPVAAVRGQGKVSSGAP